LVRENTTDESRGGNNRQKMPLGPPVGKFPGQGEDWSGSAEGGAAVARGEGLDLPEAPFGRGLGVAYRSQGPDTEGGE